MVRFGDVFVDIIHPHYPLAKFSGMFLNHAEGGGDMFSQD